MKIKVKMQAIIKEFKETLLDMICGIKEIRSNPIYGLGMLSSAIATGISCIGAIVAYERELIGRGEEGKKYKRMSQIEKLIPYIFMVVYAVAILYPLIFKA